MYINTYTRCLCPVWSSSPKHLLTSQLLLRFVWPKYSGQAKRSGCSRDREMNSSKRHWPQCLQCSTQGVGGGGPLALVCCSVFLSSASADGFMVADIWEPFTVPRLWPQEWCELFWQFDPRLLHCFMIWVTSPVTRGATSAASSKRHWLPWVEQQYILGTVKQRNASEVTLQLFPSL